MQDLLLHMVVMIITVALFFLVYIKVGSFYDLYEVQDIMRDRLNRVHSRVQKNAEGKNALYQFLERHHILSFLKNVNKDRMNSLRLWLQKAGFRSANSVAYYVISKISISVSVFFISVIVVVISNLVSHAMLKLMIPVALTILVYMLIDARIQSRIQDRQQSIDKGIPDALDLMVICSEAGMGIEHALRRVALEIEPVHPVLSEEFRVTVAEMSVASHRTQVLEALMERVDTIPMQSLITSIIQSQEFGTPLSSTLETLSEESRKERMLAAESRAARLPALMTLPLMFFILPTLFIVLIGPIIVKALSA